MRRELRDWQKEAIAVYLDAVASGETSVLWEATPGAGKTVAALRVCLHQLKTRSARRMLIVVPTTHLKIQWARAAEEYGLYLDTNFGNPQGGIARDYHGLVLTYQQIGNRPKLFANISRNTVVVLDEVHHSGDGLTWGNSLRIALSEVSFTLCLSGTAFRSDNNKIPFVKYNKAGISEPDYVYSYSTAVSQSVCRPTVFFTFGGEVAWSSGETRQQANFSDALDRVGRTHRLRAALDPDSGWIEPMLKEANTMLMAIRREHPEAAGLLVASSQKRARALARLLHSVSGQKPVVVLSEEPSASKKLKDFTVGSVPWLVACNMVSEGVDIPRLRIGVYATTIRTKLYFRQFLGRIVRKTPTPSGVQPAFFYLPADPWLTRLAEEIEHEQRHYINAKNEDEFFQFGEDFSDKEKPEKEENTWQALIGTNSGIDSIITGGGQLSLWKDENSQQTISSDFAVDNSPIELSTPNTTVETLSRSEMKEAIARELRSLVTLHHQDTGQPHSHIHALLNRKQSVKSQRECTEHQLKERIELLEEMIEFENIL